MLHEIIDMACSKCKTHKRVQRSSAQRDSFDVLKVRNNRGQLCMRNAQNLIPSVSQSAAVLRANAARAEVSDGMLLNSTCSSLLPSSPKGTKKKKNMIKRNVRRKVLTLAKIWEVQTINFQNNKNEYHVPKVLFQPIRIHLKYIQSNEKNSKGSKPKGQRTARRAWLKWWWGQITAWITHWRASNFRMFRCPENGLSGLPYS